MEAEVGAGWSGAPMRCFEWALLAEVMEVSLVSLRRALDERDLPGLDGVERAGAHLVRFFGKPRAELSVPATCRYCRVPERIEVPTRMALLLLNSNFVGRVLDNRMPLSELDRFRPSPASALRRSRGRIGFAGAAPSLAPAFERATRLPPLTCGFVQFVALAERFAQLLRAPAREISPSFCRRAPQRCRSSAAHELGGSMPL